MIIYSRKRAKRKRSPSDDLLQELKSFREGRRPIGYNETLKWLMVNDQMPEQVMCCDKFLCRAFVANLIGETYLRKIYQAERTLDDIALSRLPAKFAAKANHDSGSTYFVSCPNDWGWVKRRLKKKLKITYGVSKGEWAYAYIQLLAFIEELMYHPVIDYKFHCCAGEVCWVQIIWNRNSGNGPKETIVDKDYTRMGLHMDQNFAYCDMPPPEPKSWREMLDIASTLSESFKYVRVDLYEYQNRPSFGELTFWPLAGQYSTSDEPKFGQLLDLETANSRPLIHDFFSGG